MNIENLLRDFILRNYKTINEQIPKGNQKDRNISSLWW